MSLQYGLTLRLLLLMFAMSQLVEPVQARKRLCGEALSEALDMICVNGFSRKIKRDLQVAEGRGLLRKWLALLAPTDEENGAQGDRHRHRHRRRIAHECCREGCTYEDIMEYCA